MLRLSEKHHTKYLWISWGRVLFEQAYAQGGTTYTSIPGLYFSLNPPCHSINSWFESINKAPYLLEVLEQNNYSTQFLDNFIPKSGWKRLGFASEFTPPEKIRGRLREIKSNETSFIGLHYNGCHRPYFKPEEALTYFEENLAVNKTFAYRFSKTGGQEKKKVLANLTSERKNKLFRFLINRFDEKLKETDQTIGKFLQTLKEQGSYKNSLIIITADHGERLAEGKQGHYFSNGGITSEATHVPLIVKFPKNRHAGKEVSQIVRLIDLLPTITDYIEVNFTKETQGKSLLPAISGKNMNLKSFANSGGTYSMRNENYNLKYINWSKTIDLLQRISNKKSNTDPAIKEQLKKYDYRGENEFKVDKSWARTHPNLIFYRLDSSGDETNAKRYFSEKKEIDGEKADLGNNLTSILESCPKNSPETKENNDEMSSDLKKKLNNLGYLSN